MKLFYVSYCTPMDWKGAAFVEADSIVEASVRADKDGFAAVGDDVQVLVFQYDNLLDVPEIPPEKRNRLLGNDELVALWPDAAELMDYDDHA